MRRTTYLVLVAGTLVAMAKCSDGVGLRPLENSVGVIMSAPVRVPPGSPGRGAPAAAASASGTSVVYVSLSPGAVPAGVRATIANEATGQSVATALVNGGFDPVPLAASIGDTLAIDITSAVSAVLAHVRVAVSPVRPLKVVRTSPPSGGHDVPLNAAIVAVFSAPIDTATLSPSSFGLVQGSTTVAGTVRSIGPSGISAEFYPNSPLAPLTDYQLFVTQAIHDLNGVPLAATVTATFTTAASAPTTGNLQVTISGLPVTGIGLVTVSGPGGFSQTVTASSTLSALAPGTYTIAGLDVLASGASYGATPTSQTILVTTSSTAAVATVTYVLLTTGSLQITLTGLPGGTAAITVTGPSGYTQVVAASTTLSALVPGTYTITAINVLVSSAVYGPTPASQTVLVIPSTMPASVTVTYAVVPSGWGSAAGLPTRRWFLAAGVINGILYAVGGASGNVESASLEAYAPATNSWTTKAPMPTARYALGVGVVNGVLYAVGGAIAGQPVATLEAYDPVTDSWTTRAPMPTARQGVAVGVVGGVLYAVGGYGGATATGQSTVEAYDPATNTWTTKAAMPTARYNLTAGVVNGVLYAVGGFTSPVGDLATVEAYDPATNTWTTKAAMPTTRDAFAVGVINALLYAVGGIHGPPGGAGGEVLATMEAYDPLTNSWTTKAPMPTARLALAGGVVSGILYAVGGETYGGGLSTVEAYIP